MGVCGCVTHFLVPPPAPHAPRNLQKTPNAPPPHPPPFFAAYAQQDEFARLKEAERDDTITEEDKAKLDEWRRKMSEGGAFCAFTVAF